MHNVLLNYKNLELLDYLASILASFYSKKNKNIHIYIFTDNKK